MKIIYWLGIVTQLILALFLYKALGLYSYAEMIILLLFLLSYGLLGKLIISSKIETFHKAFALLFTFCTTIALLLVTLHSIDGIGLLFLWLILDMGILFLLSLVWLLVSFVYYPLKWRK
ncbi:hypothetical protein JKY72_06890 [Candidatus Gracilibacteria bacterium]|nr:hypothetical protein [Candidatus Gracilibacteria bacterium]